MTRIALDLDSTLADTRVVAYELMFGDDHDRDPQESPTWDWPIEEYGAARFLNAMWHAWTLRGEQIPPLEENIAGKIARLSRFGEVDIVTAHANHLGITEAKEEWVVDHGIDPNAFVVVETKADKTDLNYDVFIDDKPTLPEKADDDQTVYLYDWPYNRDASGEYTRVESLDEVIDAERARHRVTA